MSELESEGQNLLSGLTDAVEQRWSGLMRVISNNEQIGSVVMKEGQIAWAVCKYQKEDLGTFLLRKGHVTPDQLREVRKKYELLGKTRKLASLLEEEGIADRPTLQRCLLLHIRRALACMLSVQHAFMVARDGDLRVDEQLVFSLEQLLPTLTEDEDPVLAAMESAFEESSTELMANPFVLMKLAEIPGYQGSLVAAIDGRLFAGHGFDRPSTRRPLTVGVPATWMSTSTTYARDAGLGTIKTAVVECTMGALLTRWLDPYEGVFLALFLGPDAKIGIAKHRVSMIAAKLEQFVAQTLTQNKVKQ